MRSITSHSLRSLPDKSVPYFLLKSSNDCFWSFKENLDTIEKNIFSLPKAVNSSLDFYKHYDNTWWRHQMETFSALLAICADNSPVPGEFSAQRPVTRSFDVSFDLRLNKRLSKQWWGWWFETLSHPLWRHRNEFFYWRKRYTASSTHSNWREMSAHLTIVMDADVRHIYVNLRIVMNVLSTPRSFATISKIHVLCVILQC